MNCRNFPHVRHLLTRHVIAIVCAMLAATGAASAQYPSRVIKLIVPYPPAGVVDITGRLLAERLQGQLHATVIVDNRVGAAGTIGAGFVARAAADGYTLLLTGAATQTFAPSLSKVLPYNPLTDFVPITQITDGTLGLVVPVESSIKDLAGFVTAMKARGRDSNYASNGYGTYPHLAMELLKQSTGIEMTNVPFRGGNEAMTALLGGQVQVSLNHLPVILPLVRGGKLRVLATSGMKRSPLLPDVPTLKESGYDVVASVWFGLFAPAGTPRSIVEQISAAVARAAQDPVLKSKLLAQGDEVRAEGPDKFLALEKSELQKWAPVIAKAGIVSN
ncbi:MAG TPA: tripartite tricarboxylate transporter substrate binding protein [Xanthobacteraceae bacterium]|nr:tripartite tricarboxylate transporter substrate binding protein [Xanthobacteraceae bacterium]